MIATDKHPPFCSTRVESVSDLMMGLAVVQAFPNLLPDQSDCRQISHAFPLVNNNYQLVCDLCAQLIIALRLVMSGDVELNPGPLDQGESIKVQLIGISD